MAILWQTPCSPSTTEAQMWAACYTTTSGPTALCPFTWHMQRVRMRRCAQFLCPASVGTRHMGMPHAGVLGFAPGGGFWLVHSAPRFPDSPSYGSYTGKSSCSTL
jgi:hypothetical protein